MTKVYAEPDLNEGRNGPKFVGYMLVHANGYHSMFAEEWGYRKYGNKIAFIRGTYGSNAIVDSWFIRECKLKEVVSSEIIDKVEEAFVTKLWE